MPQIKKSEFYERYASLIEGKEFVEYKDYYFNSRDRFWQAFDQIAQLDIDHASARTIDIGGGIMAVLLQDMLGHEVYVGDVNDRAAADVNDSGIPFMHVDLTADDIDAEIQYDLVVLQEVIEHIPTPPYIVLGKIRGIMKKGGYILITTPNGYRLRNLIYMLLNMNILDKFRYPAVGESMGHQHEYRFDHMTWHTERSGLHITLAKLYNDGWRGSTAIAKIFWYFSILITMIPHFKNGIMVVAKNK